MKTPVLSKSRSGAVIMALMIGPFLGPSASGYDDGATPPVQPNAHKRVMILHNRKVAGRNTLGYGPPGLHSGVGVHGPKNKCILYSASRKAAENKAFLRNEKLHILNSVWTTIAENPLQFIDCKYDLFSIFDN